MTGTNHSSSHNQSQETTPTPSGITWCSLFAAEAFLIIIINLLTIIIFTVTPNLRRRSAYCLVNLAIGDMLVGALPMPLATYYFGLAFNYWGSPTDITKSLILSLTGLHILTGLLSLLSLTLVSLERVVATVFPLRSRVISSRMYIAAILVTWSVALAITGVFIAFGDSSAISFYLWIVPSIVSIAIICVSYVVIYKQVRRQHVKHHQTELQSAIRRERHLAVTLFIVTVTSLMTWLPHVIIQSVSFIAEIQFSFEVLHGTILLQYANSLWNPVVYVFRMKEFRKGLVRVISRRARQRENRVHHHDDSALRDDVTAV